MERPDLAQELERLASEDLAVRERLAETGELYGGYHPEMQAVHRRNGQRLAAILDELGCWPGGHVVGPDGSLAAFLIAQHDIGNPNLLRRCRDLYAAAIEAGDADPANLAKLEDRIRYFEGRLQWYGTHWGWDEQGRFGSWPPVEEPETVDDRRATLGLAPLAEAMAAARAERPADRPVDEVLAEHRRADTFAQQSGWRSEHQTSDQNQPCEPEN